MATETSLVIPESMLNLLVAVTEDMDRLKKSLRLLQNSAEEMPSLQSWSLDFQSSINTRLSLFRFACKDHGITMEKGKIQ